MEESRHLKKKRKALSSGNNELLISATVDLAAYYSRENDYQNAIKEYRVAAELYKEQSEEMDYARMQRMIGEVYVSWGKFGKSLGYFQTYLKTAESERNLIEQQRAYASIGHMYLTSYLTNYETSEDNKMLNVWLTNAKKMFIISLRVSEKISDISKRELMEMTVRLFINLGVVAEFMGELDEAINLFQKSIEKSSENDIFDQLERAYSLSGAVFAKKNDFSKAIKSYSLAIKIAARLDDKISLICASLEAKAEMFLKLQDFQAAKFALLKSYKLKKKHGTCSDSLTKHLKVVTYMCLAEDKLIVTNSDDYATRKSLFENIADGACILKQYPVAIEYYHKMYESSIKNGDANQELSSCYISLAQTYVDNKQYDLAIKYFRLELDVHIGNIQEQLATYYNIADVTEKHLDLEKVEDIYREAITECSSNELKIQVLQRWYKTLNKVPNNDKKISYVLCELESLGYTSEIEMSSQDSQNDSQDIDNNIWDDIDVDDITDNSDNSDIDTSPAKSKRHVTKQRGITVRKNAKGETQLHTACINGSTSLVKGLLSQGHPVNVRDYCGWLPIHEASLAGYVDIVKLLLDNGASINDRGGANCNGMTPLHDAASNGHLSVIECLLDQGASALLKNNDRQTSYSMLKSWRSTVELNSVEETYYQSVLDRLKSNIIKAGLNPEDCNVSTIGNSALIAEDSDSNQSVSSGVSVESSTEYKKVMNMIRRNPEVDTSNNLKRKSIERKSALLGLEEVGEDWLEDDLYHAKRKTLKPLSNFLNTNTKKATDRSIINQNQSDSLSSIGRNRSGSFTSIKGQDSLSSSIKRSNNSSSRRSESPIQFATKPKKKLYTIQPKLTSFLINDSSSNETPMDIQEDIFEVKDTPIVHCSKLSTSKSIQLEPTISVLSVDVTIANKVFKVPISRNKLATLTIGWLIQEAGRRYSNLEGSMPNLQLQTSNGALLDENDSLSVLFPSEAIFVTELNGVVINWRMVSLSERYLHHCEHLGVASNTVVIEALSNSGDTLNLRDLFLSSTDIPPVMKIVMFADNLTKFILHGNIFRQESVQALLSALKSLPNLSTLDLSLTNINHEAVIDIADIIEKSNSEVLTKLICLNLSYNPLTNRAIEALKVITKLLRLQEIYLADVGFTKGIFDNGQDFCLDMIHTFDVCDNTLSKDDILQLVKCFVPVYISKLSVADNMIEEQGLASEIIYHFQQETLLTNLNTLDFSGSNVTDFDVCEIISFLPMTANLAELLLNNNNGITGLSLRSLFENLEILPKVVSLKNCKSLTKKFNTQFEWTASNSSIKPKCKTIQLMLDYNKDKMESDKLIRQWQDFHGDAARVYSSLRFYLELSVVGQAIQL